ncbi:hypothetical protein MMC11_000187 [Xylographa trunciseda]|nr:hypothetical protein [Xylographa trunciseda]
MVRHSTLWILLFFVAQSIASATFAIQGIRAGVNAITGQRPFRQEFSTFQNAGPAFDLYIQALQQFSKSNQSVMLSYYAVAGTPICRGMGFREVILVQLVTVLMAPYSFRPGTGPIWHYTKSVDTFKQLLHANARSIAATYNSSNGATYRAAAETFRIPYWDWSLNPTMPSLVNVATITITTPTGVQDVTNPLYNYTFDPLPISPDFPEDDNVSQFLSTVRWPTSLDPNAVSQPGKANNQLQANAESLHDLTYQLLASEPDYANFTSSAFSNGNSLENMHNMIHGMVGNGGHMSYLPYSSFDPVFWLHHANVDRLTTIWQALYPTSFTIPEVDSYGTFTNPQGGTEDVNTPLTPFHSSSNGTLYTSAAVRYTRTFGYAYPEVQDWNVSASQLSATVRTTINNLYNPSSSPNERTQPHHQSEKRADAIAAQYQWALNIEADVSRIPASLFLHFFLAAPPSSPDDWSSAPTLVASIPILVPPSLSPSRSTNTTPRLTHGQLPLTHALLRLPGPPLPELAPHSALPLLETALQWRARRFDGAVVANEDVGGWEAVRVKIVGRTVRAREAEDQFPAYGAWEEWVGVGVGERAWGML